MLGQLWALLLQMAYPLTLNEKPPVWYFAVIQNAIEQAWEKHRGQCELSHVYRQLLEMEDVRAKELALRLEPYAEGRYHKWFTGEQRIGFDNPLVVVDLGGLGQDPQLQEIVVASMLNIVSREMFTSDRSVPKMLCIDRTGPLLTRPFIETLLRRARPYRGSVGVIVSSFEDFQKTGVAQAMLENTAWKLTFRADSRLG